MAKKKWQAIKADTGDYKGIRHDGKDFRFRHDDTFVLEDEGLVKELDSMYGKKGSQKLAITEYNDTETREPGHNYTFGPLRSKAARDNWDRIFGKKKKKNKQKPLPGRRARR